MQPWMLTLLGFFKGNKGPYGVATAAFVLVGYLAYIDIPTIKLGIVAGMAAVVALGFFFKRSNGDSSPTKSDTDSDESGETSNS